MRHFLCQNSSWILFRIKQSYKRLFMFKFKISIISIYRMKTKTNNLIKPIQLISFDANKNLKLSQQASQVISSMEASELHVIIVAGKYRTGKSYILNRVLLNKNSGFQVGPTINACTKGLWMWPQLVQIPDAQGKIKKCIIIDTQGLGSLQQGQNTDIKIFLIAVLLSSYLIYNSVGNIDEKALENLSLVINLAQMLHKDSNQYDAQELINSFPSFMWLVRDFSLKLQDQQGEQISCSDYLQMALRYQNSSSNTAQRKNLIRKKLKTFFYDRNCFTLIRPTENQQDLQNLSKLSQNKLRPQFVTLIKKFQGIIREQIRPKKVRGKSVTPQGFIQLCKYFIQMINSGKLPTISSHWDNLCIRQSSRIIQNYTQNHMNKLIQGIQCQGDKNLNIDEKLKILEKVHNLIKKQANQKIDKSFLGKLEKQLSKQRLERCLNKIYQQSVYKIGQQRYEKVKQIIKQIFSEILIEFSTNKLQSFQQIFARFQEIKQKYRQDTRIYQSFYENSKDVFQQFLRNLKSQWVKDQQLMKQRNQKLQIIIQQQNNQIKNSQQSTNSQIRQLQKTNYRYQLQLQHKCQQITNTHQQLQKQRSLNQQLEQKIEQLAINIKKHESRQLENQRQKILYQVKQYKNQNKKLSIELASLQESYKDCKIKERKNQREMEIFKNKCSEYLKDNINLTQQLDSQKRKILDYQNKLRELKKTNFKCQSNNSSQLQSFINELNSKINHLQLTLTLKDEELRNLGKLLADQKSTNQTLLQAPQTLNYQLLKKNYEQQCSNSKRLSDKLSDYQNINYLCSFKCLICKAKDIDQNKIRQHLKNCIKSKQIDFDVSYEYNGNGDIQYVIDVMINNYEKQWTTRKTTKTIKIFLKKLWSIYPQIQKNGLFDDKHKQSELQQDDAFIEKRRAYLNQLFNEYQTEVWSHGFMLEFFAIDIQYLNEKILNISQQQQQQPVSGRYSNNKSSKNSRISSELSVDLDQLSNQNIEPYMREDGSNLLMKTCKFSKKTFNFGPQM